MYKISFSAVNVPDETYPLMESALRQKKIGQTELIEEFEEAIANYVGARFCVAVANGTLADAVAIAAMKAHIRTQRRVLVPALTFIAQVNAVRYNNMEVLFADVDENWLIDLSSVQAEIYRDTITCGTDLMGRIFMQGNDIEDACEAFGSKFGDLSAGTFGMVGTYSFFPSHTISTGEGGAIVTDIEELAKLCRAIRAHGATSNDPMDKFHFPHFGYNARMSSLQAVLGIALMKHIDEYVSKRRKNFLRMKATLGGFYERPDEAVVPHGYPIEFKTEEARNIAMRELLKAGIECRKFFSCIPHEEKTYITVGHFPVSDHISHTYLYVPCHQNMTDEDVRFLLEKISTLDKRVIKSDGQERSQHYSEQTPEGIPLGIPDEQNKQ